MYTATIYGSKTRKTKDGTMKHGQATVGSIDSSPDCLTLSAALAEFGTIIGGLSAEQQSAIVDIRIAPAAPPTVDAVKALAAKLSPASPAKK